MFSFLHLGSEPPKGKAQAADLHVGNNHYLWCDGSVSWVEPPSSVPQEARSQILWAHQQMRQAAGVATRSEDSQEAHSGVAIIWESSDKHAMIHERGLNLETFESSLWRLHGHILGVDVPLDCVRYPRDFVVHSVDEELAQLERVVGLFGGYSSVPEEMKPYLRRKLSRLVIRDMGHLPEVDALLEAIAKAGEPLEDEDAATAVDPMTALNGAQGAFMIQLLTSVATGQLPRETGVESLTAAFPFDRATSERIMGTIGRGFVPAQLAAAAAPALPVLPTDEAAQ